MVIKGLILEEFKIMKCFLFNHLHLHDPVAHPVISSSCVVQATC